MSVLAGVLLMAGAVLVALGLVGLAMKVADCLCDRIGPAGLATVSVVSGLVLLVLAYVAGAAP